MKKNIPQFIRNFPFCNSCTILSLILGGTVIFVMLLLLLLLLLNYFALGNSSVFGGVMIGLIFFVYVLAVAWYLKNKRVRMAGIMLLSLYMLLATLTVVLWSITAPFGLLIFGFAIVLSGMVLGSKFTMPTAFVVVTILGIVQLCVEHGFIMPNRVPVVSPPTLLDVAGFGTVFLILALIAWIFGQKMEQSLEYALKAEDELQKEKGLLALRLEHRTRKLQTVQLKEMQQLYRFAELGQLSTSLLHDLANHLTALTIDIEDIHKKQHSQAIARAKTSIYYLDQLVDRVRGQLQGDSHVREFNALFKIQETVSHLKDKAKSNKVEILIKSIGKKSSFVCYGDPTRFRQILTILISNAVDAYEGVGHKNPRTVQVEVQLENGQVRIDVKDWGKGIVLMDRSKIFKPFYSTKKSGMGIGLFISKQMATAHFKGDITFDANEVSTTFSLRIPKAVNSKN